MSDVVVQFGGRTDQYEASLRRVQTRTDSVAAFVEKRWEETQRRAERAGARLFTVAAPSEAQLRPLRELEEGVARRRAAAMSLGAREAERDAVDASRRYRRAWLEANRDVEQSGLLTARQLRRGFMAVAGALGLGVRLMEDYAERFPSIRGPIEDITREIDRFKLSLARDLSTGGGGGIFADIVRWGGQARETVTDLLADYSLLGVALGGRPGKSGRLRDLMEAQEGMDLDLRRERRGRLETLGQRVSLLRGGGDEAAEARAQAELFRTQERERIAGLVNSGEISGQTAADLREGVEAMAASMIAEGERQMAERVAEEARRAEAERTRAYLDFLASVEDEVRAEARLMRAEGRGAEADRYEARMTHDIATRRAAALGDDDAARIAGTEFRAAEAEAAAAERRTARDLAGRRERLALDAQRTRLDLLRMDGLEREAELEAVRLTFAQRIADIRRDELLTEEDKRNAIAEQERLREMTLEATERRFGAERPGRPTPTLSPGVALGLQLQRAILGAGGRQDPARIAGDQLKEAQRQTRLLEQMLEDGGGPVG